MTVMYANSGRPKEARAQCEAGRDLWAQALRLFPDDLDALAGLNSSQNDVGALLEQDRKPEEATAAWRDSIATAQRRLALAPDDPRDVSHIAGVRMQLADVLDEKQPDEAESEWRLASEAFESLGVRF